MVDSNTVFIFFGPPGSGKGTLARLCYEHLHFEVLSTGNLCRKHVAEGTELGRVLKRQLTGGALVSDELITQMVKGWFVPKVPLQHPIILDGYPRTRHQAECFDKMRSGSDFDFNLRVIFFEISEETIIKRLARRLVCSNKDCQAVYSLDTINGEVSMARCTVCQESLVKRDDDEESVVKARLSRYPLYRSQLLSYYKSVGQPIEYLSAENRTIQEVFDAFKKSIR